MDTLTHALSGALLARATAPAERRSDQLSNNERMAVGFAAAVFPDVDFFLRFIDPLTYLNLHRSFLNSVLLLPLWALLLALLFSLLLFYRRYTWRACFGVCAMAMAIHIVGDVITSFGTMIFAPVSFARISWPTTFIIDPYFSAILIAGVTASLVWKAKRLPAITALAVLAVYVGFQGVLHARGLSVAERYAAANKLVGAETHALPQPFSPFNWMLVTLHENVYHIAYVNLMHTTVAPIPENAGWLRRIAAAYRPVDEALWSRTPQFGQPAAVAQFVKQVWMQERLQPYREFALLPALYRVDNQGRNVCVWFRDLRFALVGRNPIFPFGLCRRNDSDAWVLHRLTGAGVPEPL
ncbi:MAG: metal-dependent hydrolase [Acidiferrobacterales bacterium]